MKSPNRKRPDPLIIHHLNEEPLQNLTPIKNRTISKFIKRSGTGFLRPIAHKGKVSLRGRDLLVIRSLSSCVYEVGHQIPDSKIVSRYALKCISMQCENDDSFEIERRSQLEIAALRQVSHEHVMTLLDDERGELDFSSFFSDSQSTASGSHTEKVAFRPNRYRYVLSPLYDTNLDAYIKTYGCVRDEERLSQLFGGICSGVEAIHAEGMRHNNLNPRHVLLKFSDEDRRRLIKNPEYSHKLSPWPVICDFGSVSPVTVQISSRWQAAEVAEFHLKNSSPAYRAPEIWKIAKSSMKLKVSLASESSDTKRRKSKGNTVVINSRADAFSVGCILYYMMFRRHAFKRITSAPGKLPSRWLAFIPPKICDKVPQLLLYTSLGMMIEVPQWRLDVTHVLTSVLPKGRLTEPITQGIWNEYNGAPCLERYESLIECKGTPLTLNVPQSPISERRRAVYMLGKGGTVMAKGLESLEEDANKKDDAVALLPQIQSISLSGNQSEDESEPDPIKDKYKNYDASSSQSSTRTGLLKRENSIRSDFHAENMMDESSSNSYISWSDFHSPMDSSIDVSGSSTSSIFNNDLDCSTDVEKTFISREMKPTTSPLSSKAKKFIFSNLSKNTRKKINSIIKSKHIIPEIAIFRGQQTHENDNNVILGSQKKLSPSDSLSTRSSSPDRSTSPGKKRHLDTHVEETYKESIVPSPISPPRIPSPKSTKDDDNVKGRTELQVSLQEYASSSKASIMKKYRSFLHSPKNINEKKTKHLYTDSFEASTISNEHVSESISHLESAIRTSNESVSSQTEKIVKNGPLRQKITKPKKHETLRTVYLYLTDDAELICRSRHDGNYKVLSQVSLCDCEFVDVTLIGGSSEGDGYDFAISYSNSKRPSEMCGLRLLAANEVDARSWADCIKETWQNSRYTNMLLDTCRNGDENVCKEDPIIC